MFKQFNFKKVGPILVWLSIAVMIIAFFMVEYVNYVTTAESLYSMFGEGVWIGAMALSMVAIDVAALILVFIPEGAGKASTLVMRVLLIVWGIVSLLDMLLSWYFTTVRMEGTQVVAPSIMGDMIMVMPVAIAFMLWGVQFGMIYTLGALIGGTSRQPRIAPQLTRVPERG